jgi:DNA-binding LacI/PurR family transcriptional regulator
MGIDFTQPTPLYEQLAQDIKAQIASGKLAIGAQVGSHHELSKKHGISIITVKKALSDLIQEGFLYSRVGKGTFVARKSRQMNIANHQTIALVLRDLRNPFFSLVAHSIEKEANDLDYHVLLSSSGGEASKEDIQIKHFLNIGAQGLIIASLTQQYRASAAVRKIHLSRFPYLMVSYIHDEDIRHVGVDHELGGFMAGMHLVELGYTHIGYISGGKNNLLSEVRQRGLEKALKEGGLNFELNSKLDIDIKKDRFNAGYEAGVKFLRLTKRPEAFFAYSDLVALGFIRAIHEAGFRVPFDVAVVGFDDIELAQYSAVPLTTIRQPTEEIGKKAVETLTDLINGKEVPLRISIKPELIVRNSCGMIRHNAQPSQGSRVLV